MDRRLDGGGLANWGVRRDEVECRGGLKRLEEGLALLSGLVWKRKDGGVCSCVRISILLEPVVGLDR